MAGIDIPHRGQRPAGPPAIYIQESADRYRMSTNRSNSYNSIPPSPPAVSPMSIPNAREYVPPPLPPPTHIPGLAGPNGFDSGWDLQNRDDDINLWGKAVTPGSSLYGSSVRRERIPERQELRRGSSSATVVLKPAAEHQYARYDEGYASLSSTSIGSNRSRFAESPVAQSPRFQVHEKYQSNVDINKGMLDKLNVRRGSDNTTPPKGYAKTVFSSSAHDSSPTSRIAAEQHRNPTQLKPLSLPIITSRALVESPLSRWAEAPLSSTISPNNPFPRFTAQGLYDNRSPSDTIDSDRSPLPYIRRSGSGSVLGDDASSIASRSYDQRTSPDRDGDFQEETGFRRLHIDEYSSRHEAYSPGATTGIKRRASSPPVDEGGPSLHTVGSASDLFRRRESVSRTSPSPRFHSTSGSVSSTASGPRSNSYASTLSVATSVSSYGRLSPGGISPGSTDMPEGAYVTTLSLNPSPRGSSSRPNHQRSLSSDTRPLMTRKPSDTVSHPKLNGAPKLQGVFMCECCPKKPKKFDSQEELNAHEQEKQYECAYCRNRFKNKNEAERHQNSLHLRRHSWCCAALSGFAAAFHNSPNRPNEADTCGYCGEDFSRSGISSGSAVATDQDWEIRIGHLQEMHKFGECNHAKKFFRADHFRQHLKHSHAGTSGKWTNMLENACMKDEPLPEPIRGPQRVSPGGSGVSRINEEDEII